MMKLSALLLALALIPVYQIGFAGEIVGAWVFDEDQGDKIKDISGTGNDGIVHGAKWTKEGKFGGALEFDGDDDWVEVPNHESLQFPKGTDFTLACWIKITTPEPSPPMLIAKNYHTTSQMLPWYALYYANQNKSVDGSVSFFLRDKNSTNYHISSQSKIDDGDWHHVAGIREDNALCRRKA
ncbi:TPA: hypothetical protein EYP37_08960 [Candidatus Poribacteria bacterium]|nr:hypothetical protein [Candidatus Poribacteria bacterium]